MMIYQSGYLTIKDFDKDFGSFLLDFPNKEVQQGFLSLAASGYFASKKDADGTADEALAKIEERGYARPYGADGRQVIRIGASFSSETGTVGDWKTVSDTLGV